MESAPAVLAITVGMILVLLANGMWIACALGVVGFILLAYFVGGGMVGMLGVIQFNSVAVFTFTMLPLFIFMGEIILRSGMSQRMYEGANTFVGFLPGGLLHTNIVACSIFAAVSGSSMATAATIGTVAVPELQKRGYDQKLLTGSLAAGGTLGILIPPSMGFIIYGVFVQESIGKLFMAGIFPGIILAGLFMLYIAIRSIIDPRVAPERSKLSLKAMVAGFTNVMPFVVLMLMVMGTIYLGLCTPTESAAMGAVIATIFCALYRKLTWQVIKEASVAAAVLTAWALFIVIGAQIMAMGLSMLKVPAHVAATVASLEVNRLVILALVVFMYIILGMFLESISMMLLTLPVTYPLMMSLGFDSVWFGVVIVLMSEMALITPPVGLNLYVIHGITGRKYLDDIIKGSIPFFLCMLGFVAVLTAFPSLATWLPSQMIQNW